VIGNVLGESSTRRNWCLNLHVSLNGHWRWKHDTSTSIGRMILGRRYALSANFPILRCQPHSAVVGVALYAIVNNDFSEITCYRHPGNSAEPDRDDKVCMLKS